MGGSSLQAESNLLTDCVTNTDRKGQAYSYDCPQDTDEYARSLEKFYVMNGSSPPALVLSMTIGIAEFDHVLKSPPFSNLTTKAMQEGYIPINSDLSKEILRRSHFLLQEIDNSKTDHPLRDNSMRLRMPQPSQWTREKRIKFLEEKNMLELSRLDVDFLRDQVGEISDRVEQFLASHGKEAGKRGHKELERRGAFLSDEFASTKAPKRKTEGDDDALDQHADGDRFGGVGLRDERAEWVSRRPILQSSIYEFHSSDPLNRLYDSVATRLYGIANGSIVLQAVSEESASATLEYLLNNKSEASRFLKVGQGFYNGSDGVAPDEKIDKCIGDLVKFHQRKRIKSEPHVAVLGGH